MSNTEAKPKQLTASERIENLERSLVSLYQTADNMARDLLVVKDAIKLLGNKVDSIVKASNSEGGINDETVSKIMIENNVEELKGKVDGLIANGILEVEEEVTDSSFLVGRELDENGVVQNPRLQFALQNLQPDLIEKLKGKKATDIVVLEEGKLSFEVLEVYGIRNPVAAAPEAIEVTNEGNDTDAPAAN